MINSMDYDLWIKVHLESGITDDASSWDLAFRRYAVRVNGGESGEGYGVSQFLEGDLLQNEVVLDEAAWATDGVGQADTVFFDWYAYDGTTHQLSRNDRTYFVRSFDGERYYALQVIDYYSPPPAGDSGCITLNYTQIDAPDNAPPLVEGDGRLPTERNPGSSSTSTADEDDANSGCYSGPPNHDCDCDLSIQDCRSNGGTWTDQCECDASN